MNEPCCVFAKDCYQQDTAGSIPVFDALLCYGYETIELSRLYFYNSTTRETYVDICSIRASRVTTILDFLADLSIFRKSMIQTLLPEPEKVVCAYNV